VCPFAHAGEKAVRRDPRLHQYTGIACPDMKKTGGCIRGERCPYAHNVFEYWLHPTRYRTQLCNDGPACRRGICFFAHSLDELRVPACKPYVSPEALALASLEAIQQNPHPLGVQLAGPAHPLAPHNHAHAAAAQQAALAALNARPGGAPRGPQPYHTQTQPHPLGGGPAPQHPHSAAYPPRISSDYSNYGALPRWSDAGSTRSSLPAGEGYSYDGGGRLSLGDGGGYGGGRQSAPERGSLDAHAEAFQARPYQQQQQQQQQPYPRDQAGPAQFQQHYHPSTLSTSPTHAAAQAQRLGGGRAGPPPPAAPFPPPRSDGSGSGGSPERRSGVASPDGSLAHSLASLKIALAAHNSASSTASVRRAARPLRAPLLRAPARRAQPRHLTVPSPSAFSPPRRTTTSSSTRCTRSCATPWPSSRAAARTRAPPPPPAPARPTPWRPRCPPPWAPRASIRAPPRRRPTRRAA
jgi:hypothetical protein